MYALYLQILGVQNRDTHTLTATTTPNRGGFMFDELTIVGTEHAEESDNNLDCLSGNQAKAVKESIELYARTNEEGE